MNGVRGGNAAIGTVTSNGIYAAPSTLPTPDTLVIEAVSAADASANASSDVTLWNATPVLQQHRSDELR